VKSGLPLLSALCALLAGGSHTAPAFADEEWRDSPFLVERNAPRFVEIPDNSAEQEIQLQGILWDPQAPTAILNNRVVSPGDSLGRWEVVEIQKTQVVLSDGSTTRTLRAE
jgi:hypothetical protein